MTHLAASDLIRHTKETYGESFQADLFEQYKHYVESAEKISERRVAANNFLLTVNAFLVTLYGLLASSKYNTYWSILVPIAGLLVALTWHRIITSYRDLNTVKFEVIHELEQRMPAALYDYEWKRAGEGRGGAYRPLSHLERWIPIVFIALYVLLALVGALGSISGGIPVAGQPATIQSASSALALNPFQTVFMLFFAIFWGAVANVQPRWKAFQLPLIHLTHVRNRVLLSFVLLNLLPLVFFAYVVAVLGGSTARPHGNLHAIQLVVNAVIPAFAVFGFYRLWLGVVELWPESFYARAPSALEEKYRHVEPTFRKNAPIASQESSEDQRLPVVDLGSDSGRANVLWAIGYIAIAALTPWLP